jgi:hypothetical protein
MSAYDRIYVAEWLLAVADDDDAQPNAAGDALIALALAAVPA